MVKVWKRTTNEFLESPQGVVHIELNEVVLLLPKSTLGTSTFIPQQVNADVGLIFSLYATVLRTVKDSTDGLNPLKFHNVTFLTAVLLYLALLIYHQN